MPIGLEGDTRKFKGKPTYSAPVAAALEVKDVKAEHCLVCGREIGVSRKNWGGYCYQCFNE